MKKALSLVLVSMLGGLFTLTAYKIFIEKPEIVYEQQKDTMLENFNTTFNTTANLAAETTDFTVAAEQVVEFLVARLPSETSNEELFRHAWCVFDPDREIKAQPGSEVVGAALRMPQASS